MSNAYAYGDGRFSTSGKEERSGEEGEWERGRRMPTGYLGIFFMHMYAYVCTRMQHRPDINTCPSSCSPIGPGLRPRVKGPLNSNGRGRKGRLVCIYCQRCYRERLWCTGELTTPISRTYRTGWETVDIVAYYLSPDDDDYNAIRIEPHPLSISYLCKFFLPSFLPSPFSFHYKKEKKGKKDLVEVSSWYRWNDREREKEGSWMNETMVWLKKNDQSRHFA